MKRQTKFEIALSFAGENREYVDQVATLLRQKGIKVFYDLFEEYNLWGKNLYDYLTDIYQNQAKFTILFISEDYSKKLWTNHERKAMQSRAFQESEEYILPVKFDETKIPGILPTIGYLDVRTRSPEQLVEIIERKLIESGRTIPSEVIRLESSKINPIPKTDPVICKILVEDNENIPIKSAHIVFSAENGTYLETKTNSNGIGEISILTRRTYTILVAHENFRSFIYENYNADSDLEIKLSTVENVGSIIIQSTGYITGLKGRLNPINDSFERKYLYADNIAISGGKNQPFPFDIDSPLTLEDCDGVLMTIIFRFINGRTTALIDYMKPIYQNASH